MGRHKKKKKNKKTTKPHRKPYREREYELYVMWKSLPTILKGQRSNIIEGLGIKDELLVELLSITSQREFAKHFNIPDPGTLTDWNKRQDLIERINAERTRWAKMLTSNVVTGLYKKCVQEGDAARVKLWMQIVEGWAEETKVQHSGNLLDGVKLISDPELDRRIDELNKRLKKLG